MFLNADDFSWIKKLESYYPAIRAEFENLDRKHIISWPQPQIYNHGWDVFMLYGFGTKLQKNCDLCPKTTEAVENIPGITTVGFSVLAPGTKITPHKGMTNTVLRCHLGVIVPPDCALRVEETTRSWTEGQCLVFDDTYDHEAWNNSERHRTVLMIDFVKEGRIFDYDKFARKAEILDYLSVKEAP